MKACVKCGSTKLDSRGRCKPCMSLTAKAYRAANPEKAAAAKVKYRTKNKEKVAAYMAVYRKANLAKAAAIFAAYYAENRERLNARAAEWREANREKIAALNAAWAKANPEACRIKNHNRRARQCASGGKLSNGLAAKLFKLQRGKCACGCKQPLGTDYHLDHRMPLALGGTNTDDNMQLLTATCNLQKSAKHPVDFAQQRGLLL